MSDVARRDQVADDKDYPADQQLDEQATYALDLNLPKEFKPIDNRGPLSTQYESPHVQLLIPLGKDHTATLTFEASAIEANPDIFKKQG